MDGWRHRGEAGEDFVAAATRRFSQVLDDLIEKKLTDPGKVAACGTSRGGYMAVQFAATGEEERGQMYRWKSSGVGRDDAQA